MQKHFSVAINPPTLTFEQSIKKRSQSFSKLLPLYCERFMMIHYSLLLSVFDGLLEAARHVCQRMESMATSRMMRADSGRMYHGKEMA